jgi:hypothetical protein
VQELVRLGVAQEAGPRDGAPEQHGGDGDGGDQRVEQPALLLARQRTQLVGRGSALALPLAEPRRKLKRFKKA